MVITGPDSPLRSPVGNGEPKRITYGTHNLDTSRLCLTVICYEAEALLNDDGLISEILALDCVDAIRPGGYTPDVLLVDLMPNAQPLRAAQTIGELIADHAGWECYDDNLHTI